MNNYGGPRRGAGRKRGSLGLKAIAEAEARTILVRKILTRWEPIIATLIEVGLGESKYREVRNGKEFFYRKPPNSQVLLELVSFVVGKPKQELTGAVDMPQLVQLTSDIRSILEKS